MGEIIRECQTHSLVIANMEGSRFLDRKMWQSARSNKVVASELLGFDYGKVDSTMGLTVDIMQMSPLFLNFWMMKFVGKIGKCSGNN